MSILSSAAAVPFVYNLRGRPVRIYSDGEWLRCVIAEGFGKKPVCLPQELSGFESLDFCFQDFYSSYYNRIVNKASFNHNKTVKLKCLLIKDA